MAYRRKGMGSLTSDLANAIQRFEGTCTGGNCRNNNPGNLRAGPGAIGVDSRGIAIFPDYETGYAALQHQIDLNIGRGLSLQEFFGGKPGVYAGYAPAGDNNDPTHYADTVASWLGIDPNAPLGSISSGTGGDTVAPDESGSGWPSDEGGLSTIAIAALGISAAGLLWAMMD